MNTKHPYCTAIIVAAGKGTRMGGRVSKQFLLLEGREILAHTIDAFEKSPLINRIVLVANETEAVEQIIAKNHYQKIYTIVQGGAERQDSVKNGLDAIPGETDIVLIHDGVRPFVTEKMLKEAIAAAQTEDGAIVGMPVKDTIKICDKRRCVIATPNRESLMQIQTPQVFRVDLIIAAYKKAYANDFHGTDDASVAEFAGLHPRVVAGSYRNIKITTAEDMEIAAAFLREGIHS